LGDFARQSGSRYSAPGEADRALRCVIVALAAAVTIFVGSFKVGKV
jgi:hypothetical protein